MPDMCHAAFRDERLPMSMRDASAPPNTPASDPSGRRPHTPRGEAQRRALVQSAYSLIAEEGFEGLRTREVAARAGANIATLHYYFASKEDLIRAVVERLWEEFATFRAPSSVPPTTPLEGLSREIVDLEYHLRERPETFRVLFEIILRGLRDATILRFVRELTGRWESYIATHLVEGVRQGTFRQGLDVSATAADIVALLTGNISLAMTEQQPFPTARVWAHIERWVLPDSAAQPRP